MGASATRFVPKVIFWLGGHGMTGLVNALINWKASRSPGMRWALDDARWTFGKEHPLDAMDEFQKYSLAGVAQRIKGDVLLLEALTSARSVTTKIYDRESGGAEHCQLGAPTLWHADLFDWLSEKFESRPNVRDEESSGGRRSVGRSKHLPAH